MKRNSLLICSVILLLTLIFPSWADVNGTVVSVKDGEITIDRGSADNVTPGTHWQVYRNGKKKAELEAILVDEYNSYLRLVSGDEVKVGDKVVSKDVSLKNKLEATTVSSNQISVNDDVPENPETIDKAKAKKEKKKISRSNKNKVETAESAEKKYNKLVPGYTKKANFSGGTSKLRRTSVDPYLTTNAFLNFFNKHTEPVWQNTIPTVVDEVRYNVGMKSMHKTLSLDVEVTWWSEDLVDAYSDMMAFREGRTSMEQRIAMRNGLYAQKGIDKFIVFHIKLKNVGKENVQIEPFHWHAYLLDDQGNNVKAERYDQILDKALIPGQETEGNIYFLKYDASGRNFSGSHVTLVLEDILTERQTMKF